jgi:Tfp pilus assembly protein PilN
VRPVNLIPPEERRGDRGQTRTGLLPYIVLGAFIAAVVAVSAVVITSNQISDREAELSDLQAQERAARARAEALSPYAEFASLAQAREATVTSLAQSRFDWERVLRELALVIPDDIWLTNLTGTVSPDVTMEDGTEVSIRSDAAGPALTIIGCGPSHEAVAGFLEALKDIDGVTRVGISSDERSTDVLAEGGGGDDCRTRKFISRFEVVAAFDEVPVPAAAAAATTPPATTAVPAGGGASTETSEAPTETNSATEQIGEAQNATNVIPGVAR